MLRPNSLKHDIFNGPTTMSVPIVYMQWRKTEHRFWAVQIRGALYPVKAFKPQPDDGDKDMAFHIFELGSRGFRFQRIAVAFLSFASRRGFPERTAEQLEVRPAEYRPLPNIGGLATGGQLPVSANGNNAPNKRKHKPRRRKGKSKRTLKDYEMAL